MHCQRLWKWLKLLALFFYRALFPCYGGLVSRASLRVFCIPISPSYKSIAKKYIIRDLFVIVFLWLLYCRDVDGSCFESDVCYLDIIMYMQVVVFDVWPNNDGCNSMCSILYMWNFDTSMWLYSVNWISEISITFIWMIHLNDVTSCARWRFT